jgi:hypothetical protein
VFARLFQETDDRHWLDLARTLVHGTTTMLALDGRVCDLRGPGWHRPQPAVAPLGACRSHLRCATHRRPRRRHRQACALLGWEAVTATRLLAGQPPAWGRPTRRAFLRWLSPGRGHRSGRQLIRSGPISPTVFLVRTLCVAPCRRQYPPANCRGCSPHRSESAEGGRHGEARPLTAQY